MKIGEVAERLNVRTSALRFYERKGVIGGAKSTRLANNYREYSDEDFERVRLVLTLKKSGLRLEDIALLVSADSSGCETLVSSARRQLEAVESALRELRARKSALQALLGDCLDSCGPTDQLACVEGAITTERAPAASRPTPQRRQRSMEPRSIL